MNATIAIRRGQDREGLRVKSRAKGRTKSQVLPMVIQASVVFVVVFIVASFALSLAGHIMAEGQRAQIKSMTKPLAVAREEERTMRAAASSDRSQESTEEWAEQRGFVRKYAPAVETEQTYVAER